MYAVSGLGLLYYNTQELQMVAGLIMYEKTKPIPE